MKASTFECAHIYRDAICPQHVPDCVKALLAVRLTLLLCLEYLISKAQVLQQP